MKTAFIDESYRPGTPGYYLMAAIIADTASDHYSVLNRSLAELAKTNYLHELHAHELKRPELRFVLDEAASLVGDAVGVRAVVVVRARVLGGKTEQARQECVAGLHGLCVAKGVQELVFDTRRNSRQGNAPDRRDQATVHACNKARGVAVRVSHRPSSHTVGLWAADIVTHLSATAVRDRQPRWIAAFTHKIDRIVAVGLEDDPHMRFMVQQRLDDVQRAADVIASSERISDADYALMQSRQDRYRARSRPGAPYTPDLGVHGRRDRDQGFGR